MISVFFQIFRANIKGNVKTLIQRASKEGWITERERNKRIGEIERERRREAKVNENERKRVKTEERSRALKEGESERSKESKLKEKTTILINFLFVT